METEADCVRFHLYLLSCMEANGRFDLLESYINTVPAKEKEEGGKTCLARAALTWEAIKKAEAAEEVQH